MKLSFIGHAGFIIEHQGVKIAVDPFITGNSKAKIKVSDIKVDYVLVSHGHGDHLGDAIQIAKTCNALVIGVFEIANYCARKGARAHGMHIGGSHQFGDFKVKLTMALHGSSIGGDSGPAEYLGNPCGFLISLDGITIYHAGDTGLFGDMELIGKHHSIDMALLPIGDNFTMGIDDAVEAVKMLKPKLAIPMHYNTFPLIEQNPLEFKEKVESQTDSKVVILEPGESINN
ncbi:metal-dependent hydrolase [Desulfofalx alkaliphila]|uniref:metal-dependent hydrolase n=1 Tax=Desulfofalx alkaliphila TaxID=105483 RepID=UPI0004E20362|nr:metal-dependent hydrolase [Desulfofalx alkaliphila]